MAQESFLITASFPIDEGGLHYTVSIDQTGRAELTIESNEEIPNDQSIGVYRAEIGQERAVDLKNNLKRLSKKPIPDSEPAPPGTPMVLVTLEENGEKISRIIDPSTSTKAMCKVADDIRSIGEEARQNPFRVINMQVDIDKDTVVRSESVRLAVRLTAEGSKEISIANPLNMITAKENVFVFWGVRSDIPPMELWPYHSKHQKLTKEFLLNSELPEDFETEDLLKLEPSQMIMFEFNIPIDWEAGEYSIKVIFDAKGPKEKVLFGSIRSIATKLKVVDK